jgi:hypothetical protein
VELDQLRLSSTQDETDLDAGGGFATSSVRGVFAELRGMTAVLSSVMEVEADPKDGLAALATAGVAKAVDQCEPAKPAPPAKPRPAPVKRVLSDTHTKPRAAFSDQIQLKKKKISPAIKADPKPPATNC